MAFRSAARLALSVVGVTLLAAATLAAANSNARRLAARRSLTLTNAVIDFGRGADKVTLKLDLQAVPASKNPADFTVQVVITDNRTGAMHDSGPQAPTVVR